MLTEQDYNINPKEVKKRLLDLNMSQADLARALGVSRVAIHRVIHGKLPSARLMAVIKRLMLVNIWTNPEKNCDLSNFVNLKTWSRHWGFNPYTVHKVLSRHAVSVSNPQPKPPRRFTLAMQICRCMAETIGWPEAAKYFPYLEPFDEQARGWMEQIRLERVRKLQEKQQDAGGKSAV